MTGLIAIDESGDLGSRGSRFFVIAAIVTRRSRHLLKVYKSIPTGSGPEIKFYDATHEERLDVLFEIVDSDSVIAYVCVDKRDHREPYRNGNELYHQALKRLIECALEMSESRDVNILVDESGFIKNDEVTEIGKGASEFIGKNLKKCVKTSSNKCTRIADYIAGSIRVKYESSDEGYLKIIEEKISTACESLKPRQSATDFTGLTGT